MRYMILIAGDEKASQKMSQEEGQQIMAAYMKYTDELKKAGVMLAGDALHQTAKGARVTVSGGKRTVIDGPFTEAKEMIGGYWIIQVKSKEEAVEWASRCPGAHHPDGASRGREVLEISGRRARARCSDRARCRAPTPAAPHRAIWRIESARLIAGLARMVRDVGLAEELAQDALVAALEQWPESGIPDNPGAWLMATAKHRAHRRRCAGETRSSASTSELGARAPTTSAPRPISTRRSTTTSATTCCASSSSRATRCCRTEARVALTLRLLGGLTTDEIARAFLVPEPTIAQRIVRAKRTLAEAQRARSRCRAGRSCGARLASVLEVIYLVFNEGYSATAGDDWMRPALCEDALRLGRMLAELAARRARGARSRRAHGDPGVARRRRARRRRRRAGAAARSGPRALGSAPHPARPRALDARRGARRRARAVRAAGGDRRVPRARRAPPAETDWTRIAALYDALAQRRAVAGRRAQSRGRGRDGRRPRGRPRDRRRARRRPVARGLPPACRACAPTCSRSSAARRGARRVRARGRAHAATRERARRCARGPLYAEREAEAARREGAA